MKFRIALLYLVPVCIGVWFWADTSGHGDSVVYRKFPGGDGCDQPTLSLRYALCVVCGTEVQAKGRRTLWRQNALNDKA